MALDNGAIVGLASLVVMTLPAVIFIVRRVRRRQPNIHVPQQRTFLALSPIYLSRLTQRSTSHKHSSSKQPSGSTTLEQFLSHLGIAS
jgi:CRISPR/Cas system endoribonuclease Cas6 (RAMP superfamily)